MNLRKSSTIGLILLTLFVCTPVISLAQVSPQTIESQGIVPCGNAGQKDCDFDQLINLVNRIITYLIYIAIPIASIAFAYAGFELLTSGGNPSKMAEAKKLMSRVGIGFIIMLGAYLIVKQIMTELAKSSAFIDLLK